MGTVVVNLTPSKVFDLVQEMLGIGEVEPDGPGYGPWRVRQISMLKKMMARRGLRPEEVLVCAQYCKAHRLQPETYGWLLMHVDSARAWERKRAKEEKVDELFERAIAYERELSDHMSYAWLETLSRAAPQVRAEVLEQWRSARGVV